MTATQVSGVDWQPVFNRPVALAAVSDEARPVTVQAEHFARLLGCIADPADRASAAEALQLCEQTHGFPVMRGAFTFVAAALRAADAIGLPPVGRLTQQRGYHVTGWLIGVLAEDHARVATEARRFPGKPFAPRLGSPFPELEDALVGTALAEAVGALTESDLKAAEQFAALAFAARKADPRNGWARLKGLAREAKTELDQTVNFCNRVATELPASERPPAWTRYADAVRRSAVNSQPPKP